MQVEKIKNGPDLQLCACGKITLAGSRIWRGATCGLAWVELKIRRLPWYVVVGLGGLAMLVGGPGGAWVGGSLYLVWSRQGII